MGEERRPPLVYFCILFISCLWTFVPAFTHLYLSSLYPWNTSYPPELQITKPKPDTKAKQLVPNLMPKNKTKFKNLVNNSKDESQTHPC